LEENKTGPRITYDKAKISRVPIDSVRPNTWNPKSLDTLEFQRVKKAIDVMGLQAPIYVRENEGYEIVDGEQRWRACKELGFTEIEIYNDGVMSDDKAKSWTINWQQQVPMNEVDMAKLICNDMADHSMLPFSDDELESMKELLKFDWGAKEPIDPASIVQEIRLIGHKFTPQQYERITRAIKLKRAKKDVDEPEALALCADMAITQMEKEHNEQQG